MTDLTSGCIESRSNISHLYNQVQDRFAALYFLANNYLFKVYNRKTIKRGETCSELTIKTPDRHEWRRSNVFIVKLEQISNLFLDFHFEQVNVAYLVHFAITFSYDFAYLLFFVPFLRIGVKVWLVIIHAFILILFFCFKIYIRWKLFKAISD